MLLVQVVVQTAVVSSPAQAMGWFAVQTQPSPSTPQLPSRHPRVVYVTDPVTLDEAAHILGCSKSAARRRILAAGISSAGRYQHRSLSREAVEGLALTIYRWRDHIHEPESYWITGQRAADVLGVNVSRLNALVAKDRLPYVEHNDGTRMYRRLQLEVVATARDARWH